MLKLDGVAAGYGQLEVLHDVSLRVPASTIVALVGANGAGKTTTLNTISGILNLRHGSVTFKGEALERIPPHRRVEMGLVQVPQGRQVFPYMTVEENLVLGAFPRSKYAYRRRNMERVYDLFPRLLERRRQHAGTLSGGEQQMLAIARGLMAEPSLLMLDEPSLGLSPILVRTILEVVAAINADGIAILLVEQNVTQALKLARYAYVIESGNSVLDGEGEALLADPSLQRAYLGL